jgi:FKBP-type peptidyl-prolyl cis-trans isomerase FkpA
LYGAAHPEHDALVSWPAVPRVDGPKTNIRALLFVVPVVWLTLVAVSCGEDALPTPTAVPPTPAPTPCTVKNATGDDFCTQVHFVVRSDGLKYGDIKAGAGPAVKNGDKVKVQYTGWLTDSGVQFDTSRQAGRGAFDVTVGAGGVIKGWDEGLVGMKAGGKRRLVIPSELAYGAQGRPPTIPANATLTFDIELVSIG